MTHSPNTVTRVPVLIVGGGPTGLAAALELAAHGVASMVIEPRLAVDTDRPRAKTTNTRTMTHLRRWGLADTLRAAAPIPVDYAQDAVFCSTLLGKEITRFQEIFQLTLSRPVEQPERGQQVGQPVVEEVLRAAATRQELIELRLGTKVVAVTQTSNGAQATVQDIDSGAAETVDADYVLGCDGGSSLVRPAMGGSFQGGSGVRPNLSILFHAPGLAERVPFQNASHHWVLAPGAGGIVGRLDLKDTWWAIVQGVDVATGEDDPTAMVHTLVGDDIPVEIIATDKWNCRMLLADRYQSDEYPNLLIAGDAAHLNPPWGGHGFNTCVGDAVNIGWKLAAVLNGWGGPRLLPSYEPERRPVAARTIADASANNKALAHHFANDLLGEEGAEADALRATVASDLQVKKSEFHSLGLVLGYNYADSPVVTDDGTTVPAQDPIHYTPSAHPGCVLPHAWMTDGTSLYDHLGKGFTLIALPGVGVDTGPIESAAAQHGIPLTLLALNPGAVEGEPQQLRDRWAADLLLVRPDQHVAWRGYDAGTAAAALIRAAGW